MLWSLAFLVITIKIFFFNLNLMLCKCRTKTSLNISVNIVVKGKKKEYLVARIIILERKHWKKRNEEIVFIMKFLFFFLNVNLKSSCLLIICLVYI